MVPKSYIGKKVAFLTGGTGKTGYPHIKDGN
jgi:hypothetical protein